MRSHSVLECMVVVTFPYCKYRYTHNGTPQPIEECWWSGVAEEEAFVGVALIARVWEQ
jgi:hypothetical protein